MGTKQWLNFFFYHDSAGKHGTEPSEPNHGSGLRKQIESEIFPLHVHAHAKLSTWSWKQEEKTARNPNQTLGC
jgi:hypothetical protein